VVDMQKLDPAGAAAIPSPMDGPPSLPPSPSGRKDAHFASAVSTAHVRQAVLAQVSCYEVTLDDGKRWLLPPAQVRVVFPREADQRCSRCGTPSDPAAMVGPHGMKVCPRCDREIEAELRTEEVTG
jgi:hypothetical protein